MPVDLCTGCYIIGHMRNKTSLRILDAAVAVAARQGIRRTSLEDVAQAAAVSRLTVYRYFRDRRGLIEGVLERIAAPFEAASRGTAGESVRDVDARLLRLFQELAEIPYAELAPAFREVDQLYPDLTAAFRRKRDAAVDRFLSQAFAAATREGALRRSLDPAILRSLFRVTLLGLLEEPGFGPPGTRIETALATLLNVFRYGALKPNAAVTPIPVATVRRPKRKPDTEVAS